MKESSSEESEKGDVNVEKYIEKGGFENDDSEDLKKKESTNKKKEMKK